VIPAFNKFLRRRDLAALWTVLMDRCRTIKSHLQHLKLHTRFYEGRDPRSEYSR
jgi:hypothetical protein